MHLSGDRNTVIDFWRGAVLVFIFVNHIPGNLLEHLTPRNYGFSDAAEAFVFISGLSVALAYYPRLPQGDVLGVVRPAGPGEGPPLPLVHTDDPRVAALAAEHLMDRGFRRFGYFGLAGESWSQRRRDAFAAAVGAAGCPCTVYETPREVHHTKMWEDYADSLAAWVKGLAKPVGLMTGSDQLGPILLEACRRAGAAVPDEVAVIGVDNDEPLCEVGEYLAAKRPKLISPASSIALMKEAVFRLRPARRRPSTSSLAWTKPSSWKADGTADGFLSRKARWYSATTGMVVLRSGGMICARTMPRA